MTNPAIIASLDQARPPLYCTIGGGVGADGKISDGLFNISYDKPLNLVVNDAIKKGYRNIVILQGTYDVKNPIVINKDNINISGIGGVTLRVTGTGSIGLIDGTTTTVSRFLFEDLKVTMDDPISGMSLIKFGSNSANIVIRNNTFQIHTGLGGTYSYSALASPCKIIDLVGVTSKEIQNNEFLPYTDVVPIYLEGGNFANVYNNKIYNGAGGIVDFTFLASLIGLGMSTVFPAYRPCKKAIHMVNEWNGSIRNNGIWALGSVDRLMDGLIVYENTTTASEYGHMDICDNKLELCASHRQMYGKGLKFSRICDNLFGVPVTATGINVSYLDRHGTIVLEHSAVTTPNTSVSNGAFTDATKTLNQTGAFTSYTFAEGDSFSITSAASGTLTTDTIPIVGKTDADNIVLAYSLETGGGNLTSVVGYIAKSQKSDHITISGNQIHNPSKPSSNSAGIHLCNVDDINVVNNHVNLLHGFYGIKLGHNSKNINVRGNFIHFNSSNANNIGVSIEGVTNSAGTKLTDEITIGENGIHNTTHANPIYNNSTATKIIVDGISMKSSGTYSVNDGRVLKSFVANGANAASPVTVTGITASDTVVSITNLTDLSSIDVAGEAITVGSGTITLASTGTNTKKLLVIWYDADVAITTNTRIN